MREYVISKYNPEYRINGVYSINEWTSISDIGKRFATGVLTADQYKKVEQAYIDCCITLMRYAEIKKLSVCNPEYYSKCRLPRSLSSERDICQAIMDCLQEKCWARLEAKKFYIYIGYDYYIHVGTELSDLLVKEVAQKFGLFCEDGDGL